MECSEVKGEELKVQPVDLTAANIGARWIVKAFEIILENPSVIINGFNHSGIIDAVKILMSTAGSCVHNVIYISKDYVHVNLISVFNLFGLSCKL